MADLSLTGSRAMSTEQIIIRLRIQGDILNSDDLIEVANHHGLVNLRNFLTANKLPAKRVVASVPVRQLLEREKRARKTKFPPLHSLTHYWRLDASNMPDVGGLASELGELRSEISLSYVEARVGTPGASDPAQDLQSEQSYLDPAPVGVDAYWAWSQSNGKGEDAFAFQSQ
jgi:hypothetical protein